MGNFLASVGRAQPTRNVLQVLQGKMMMDQNARREQLTASELAMNNEQLAQMKRQAEAQDRLRQEGEMPVSVEGYAGKFEGGPDGEIFKYVYNLVDSAGYIDKSTGGMGTFQRRHMPEIGQLLSDPQVVSKLSQMRINLGLKNEAQARQMLAEKPDDQKALQAWQESITYLDTVRGQDKNWQAEKKRQAEEMKAKAAMINATAEKAPKLYELSPDEKLVTAEGKTVARGVPKKETTGKSPEQQLDLYVKKLQAAKEFKAKRPPDYYESVGNAVEAITRGQDVKEVYYKMVVEFPDQAEELERILFTPSTKETLQALIEAFSK